VTFQDLAKEVLGILHRGVAVPLPEASFLDLALRVFRFQCGSNLPYGGFVARRGVIPDKVTRWEEIPFLPSRAFKSAVLVCGDAESVEGIFRTSGTTRAREGRGEHRVKDLSLYRASLLPNFKAHLLPDEGLTLRILCLLPSPTVVSDSSLGFMMGEVISAFGTDGSGFFVGADGEIDTRSFRAALRSAEGIGERVLVAGTAFSLVRWVELAEDNGWDVRLPKGSRIMETGGYKGRSKEVPRARLYQALEGVFGIPKGHIVNEYGMTELLSQFYEPVLDREAGGSGHRKTRPPAFPGKGSSAGPAGVDLAERYHRGPPWVRTLVLDPLTLRPRPSGEVGVLAHLDLANLGSVAAVLTEDMGREVQGGFQLLGRTPGSEPRGCSLAMEDFLASQAGEP
jgi:hypothetical protein